jgi:hypothetical protein
MNNRHTFLSKNCKFIYHLGIIDYLQDYHMEKQAENFLKETILGRSSEKDGEISAVHPSRYAPRFVRFMASNVIVDQNFLAPKEVQRRLSKEARQTVLESTV